MSKASMIPAEKVQKAMERAAATKRRLDAARARNDRAEKAAARMETRRRLQEAIARNQAEKADARDVALIDKQWERERALANMLRRGAREPAQLLYAQQLRAAIERDADAVALAQARHVEYAMAAEAARIAEQREYERMRDEQDAADKRSN